VDGESAVIGDAHENRWSIYADHIGMAKFSSRDDNEYKKVLYAIEMVLEGHPEDKQGPAEVQHRALSHGSNHFWFANREVRQHCMEGGQFCLSQPTLSHAVTLISILDHIQVTTFYDIPPLQVLHFVARETLLTRLEYSFENSTTSPRRVVVLLGMGGAGKTQLALEYCQRMKESGNFRVIFRLDASSQVIS
jgi:hypothetical protein